jgi:glycosyltransferase involved in cell wall biosynthesis
LLKRQRFDVIEFEGIEMIPYLPTLLEYAEQVSDPPRLVFDEHNTEYMLQKRVFETDVWLPHRWPGAIYSFIQWQKLKRYEAWACRHVDAVAAVSEKDAEALRRIVPELEIAVVPNGVDVANYASFSNSLVTIEPKSLVFTGKMDFRPNVDAVMWFTRRVFPLIQRRVPDVRFYIVGQRPHPRLDRLRERPGVVVTGRVPETQPYIGNAAIYVIPLRSGGGTRLKVLEAMAMRRPIVSTSMGCDGFPVASGQEVVLADDPREFAHEVVTLLQDTTRQQALGQAAFDFATRYDWSIIVPRLEAAYKV